VELAVIEPNVRKHSKALAVQFREHGGAAIEGDLMAPRPEFPSDLDVRK
jgi:hypothetical protein